MQLSDSGHMRDADNAAIHIGGIPSTLLMRNAAGRLARAAEEMMGDNRSAFIFCGAGNNGGDGVAAALHLLPRGVKTRVLFVGDRRKLSQDTAEMERRLIALGGQMEDLDPDEPGLGKDLARAGVIIDAMFGIGLNAPLRGAALSAARLINAAGAPVLAADIPSGVEADTGRVPGEAVAADRTVTFSMAKPGHFVEPGCTFCGVLEIAGIGVPPEFLEKAGIGVHAVTGAELSLPRRRRISHKGNYGRLLIVGGSVGYTGAPTLAARAAVRGGAGLVFVAVPSDIYAITAMKNDEAMPFPLDCDAEGRLSIGAGGEISARLAACDTAVIGPGLGRSADIAGLVPNAVSACEKPLVIDADGLWGLSHDMEALRRAGETVILTPHEGEFLRMGGALTGDRLSDARSFAKEHGCVLVLKGHRTVCAFPDGEAFINTTGNPGMAKGGSGDVLAGLIGAMLCQLPMRRAVITAVWLHGRAGDLCAEKYGEYAMTASDVIGMLPEAMREISGEE
ncbi:MAG TPA: bifunctional ADP-dependent NAD(P)H-hydrate dehydratase/NAD(P)H-hydrate epimerase [Clostridiales bacterium]|nr:bifunctional ADP-dependent NAD(P)H-hydrate dehydratase/NAD(P)H-hydrate epimerase [Clostridiales bacterium]